MAENEQQMRAELERLRTENKELRTQSQQETQLRVSQKGAVSLYGIRRFPVTFYADEWERLLDMSDEIRAFIVKNRDALKKKPRRISVG